MTYLVRIRDRSMNPFVEVEFETYDGAEWFIGQWAYQLLDPESLARIEVTTKEA
jgi:hypothetical protein